MKSEFIFANTYCKEEAKTEKAINFPWKNKGEKERKRPTKTLLQRLKPLTRRHCCVQLTSSLGNPQIQQTNYFVPL